MDLLLKLYNSRCSPPGLGEEERFRFLIKGEEGIPVHPFLIRAKTKMDLEKGEGRRRLIQVPVGVGKGVVEEFVKFLYLEQLDKSVGIKEELQLLRLGMLKGLKLKREYQEKLVEIIDAFKLEGQDPDAFVHNNGEGSGDQGSGDQCPSGDQDIPEQEVPEQGNIGDVADQGNGNGGFQNGGNDDDDDDVTFIGVIKQERRQSPAPSSVLASTSRRSGRARSNVSASGLQHLIEPSAQAQDGNERNSNDADGKEEEECTIPNIGSEDSVISLDVDPGHNLRQGKRGSKRNIPSKELNKAGPPQKSRSQPHRNSKLKCKRLMEKLSSNDSNLKCERCKKTFSTKDSLLIHLRDSHKIHGCPRCDQFFNSKPQMDYHVDRVHEGKLYQCTICKKPYTTQAGLKFHVDRVHEGKLYKCTICKKSCTTQGNLKVHVDGAHNNVRHRCPRCDASYPWATGLAAHMKAKHVWN